MLFFLFKFVFLCTANQCKVTKTPGLFPEKSNVHLLGRVLSYKAREQRSQSPNLPYSEEIGSPEAAIPVLKVVQR